MTEGSYVRGLAFIQTVCSMARTDFLQNGVRVRVRGGVRVRVRIKGRDRGRGRVIGS